MKIKVKSPQEIDLMRQSGRALGQILQKLQQSVKPGVKASQLSAEAKEAMQKLSVEPAFLGHHGFPDVICISLNSEIVHGIPGDKVISEGDLVSIDLGVSYRGWITDSAISLIAGKPADKNALMLLEATKEALDAGIAAARPGRRVGDISQAVEKRLRQQNLGIFTNLEGHGVGEELWEAPGIPNFGLPGTGELLVPGMTLAIEPMASLGGIETQVDHDGWTMRTKDGSLAAHFEHTILITDSQPEVLTAPSL